MAFSVLVVFMETCRNECLKQPAVVMSVANIKQKNALIYYVPMYVEYQYPTLASNEKATKKPLFRYSFNSSF